MIPTLFNRYVQVSRENMSPDEVRKVRGVVKTFLKRRANQPFHPLRQQHDAATEGLMDTLFFSGESIDLPESLGLHRHESIRILDHVLEYSKGIENANQRIPTPEDIQQFTLEKVNVVERGDNTLIEGGEIRQGKRSIRCNHDCTKIFQLLWWIGRCDIRLTVYFGDSLIMDERSLKPGTVIKIPCVWNFSYRIEIDDSDIDKYREESLLSTFVSLRLHHGNRNENENERRPYFSVLFRLEDGGATETNTSKNTRVRMGSKFVKVYPGSLSDDDIRRIEEFGSKSNFKEGCTASGVLPHIKKTSDLSIDTDNGLIRTLIYRLSEGVRSYSRDCCETYYPLKKLLVRHLLRVENFKIQKYAEKEGHYAKHMDDTCGKGRLLVFMWYLNDVMSGGETIIFNDSEDEIRISPRKGMLLIFPANWTVTHSGAIPLSNEKIILNGWIHNDKPEMMKLFDDEDDHTIENSTHDR